MARPSLYAVVYTHFHPDHTLGAGAFVDSDDDEARDLRIASLKALGTEQVNPNARHYYLTRAVELRDDFVAGFDKKPTASTVGQLPVESFVRAMPVFLNAEDALDVEKTVVLRFPDVDEAFTVEVRCGVAIVQRGAQGVDSAAIDIAMSSLDFKKLLGGLDSPAEFLVTGDFTFAADGRTDLASFLALFKE